MVHDPAERKTEADWHLSLRRLVTNTGWVGLVVIVEAGSRILATPFRTRLLSPANYGTLALWAAAIAVATPLATGVGLSVLRWRPGAADRASPLIRAWLLTTVVIIGGTGAFAVAAFGLERPTLAWIALVVCTETLLGAAWVYARSIEQYPIAAVSVAAGTVSGVVLGTIFIRTWGTVGVLIGWALANIPAAMIAWSRLGPALTQDLRGPRGWLWNPLWSYALPATLANLGWALATWLDRILLVPLVSADDLGRYAIAYALVAGPLTGLFAMLSVATWTQAAEAHAQSGMSGSDAVLWRSSTLYAIVATPIAVLLATFGHVGLTVLAGPEYQGAAVHIIPLTFGLWLFGVLPYRNQHLLIVHRARAQAATSFVAVAFGAASLFVLVPILGPVGASWATALGYAAAFALATEFCRRDDRITARIDWRSHRDAGALAAAICIPLGLVAVTQGLAAQLFLGATATAVTAALISFRLRGRLLIEAPILNCTGGWPLVEEAL